MAKPLVQLIATFLVPGHLQALGGGGYLMKRRLNGPQVDLSHRR